MEELYIVFSHRDRNYLPISCRHIFSLSLLFRNKHRNKYSVSYPLADLTSRQSSKILENVDNLSDKIIRGLVKSNFFKSINSIEELLGPYLHARLSTYLYLKTTIPESRYYLIRDRFTWKKYSNKHQLILEIEKMNSKPKSSLYRLTKSINHINNRHINYLFKYIQKLLFRYYFRRIKHVYILGDTSAYFNEYIRKDLKSRGKTVLAFYQAKSYLLFIKSISLLLIKLLIPGLNITPTIFTVSNNVIPSRPCIKDLSKFLSSISINKIYLSELINDIIKYMIITEQHIDYLTSIFRKINATAIIHANKFPHLYALSSSLVENQCKVYLISHATHTVQDRNTSSEIVSYQMAIGLLYSRNNKICTLSTSLLADDYLNSKKINYKRIRPFLLPPSNKIIRYKDPNILRILHAGTIKELGCKRYYYESSFEYVYSIKRLLKSLYPLREKIQIVLRIRLNYLKTEISIDYIKELIRDYSDYIILSENSSFEQDLYESDCLISFSSTTLEQSFNLSKPSLCYGPTSYNHLKLYEKYRIPNNHIKYETLSKVENLLQRKFIYLDNPLARHTRDYFHCLD